MVPPYPPPFPFEYPFMGLILAAFFFMLAVSIVLKGFALWHAARGGQKVWFIVLLVVQTAGVLDLAYLLFFRADKSVALTVPAAPADSSPEA